MNHTTAITMAVFVTPSSMQSVARSDTPLKCDVGPITKKFGATQWFVYSCADERTLVVAATHDNPAMPFFFTVYQEGGVYRIYGEGTGDKTASSAALHDLQNLSESDIAALIQQTKLDPKKRL